MTQSDPVPSFMSPADVERVKQIEGFIEEAKPLITKPYKSPLIRLWEDSVKRFLDDPATMDGMLGSHRDGILRSHRRMSRSLSNPRIHASGSPSMSMAMAKQGPMETEARTGAVVAECSSRNHPIP